MLRLVIFMLELVWLMTTIYKVATTSLNFRMSLIARLNTLMISTILSIPTYKRFFISLLKTYTSNHWFIMLIPNDWFLKGIILQTLRLMRLARQRILTLTLFRNHLTQQRLNASLFSSVNVRFYRNTT